MGFTFSVEVLKQLYVPWSIEEGGLPCPQRIVTPSLPVPGGILCDLCVSRDSHVLRMQDVDRILLLSNDANMETLQHVNPSALVFGNVHFIPERCYRIGACVCNNIFECLRFAVSHLLTCTVCMLSNVYIHSVLAKASWEGGTALLWKLCAPSGPRLSKMVYEISEFLKIPP